MWVAVLALALFRGAAWGACSLSVVGVPPAVLRVSSHVPPPVPAGHARIVFAGHSSFLLQSPGGALIFTDYNGHNLPPAVPEVVTMSNPHPTHSAHIEDPASTIVLRGWDPAEEAARVDVKHKDVRIFNVPTNLTEMGGRQSFPNSIFVFEMASLCVAHLGNLNHLLRPEDLEKLGRIDVLFVPISIFGALSPEDAVKVIRQIRAPLAIPMHYDMSNPNAFIAAAREHFPIRFLESNQMIVSRRALPKGTEILFMMERSPSEGD